MSSSASDEHILYLLHTTFIFDTCRRRSLAVLSPEKYEHDWKGRNDSFVTGELF